MRKQDVATHPQHENRLKRIPWRRSEIFGKCQRSECNFFETKLKKWILKAFNNVVIKMQKAYNLPFKSS